MNRIDYLRLHSDYAAQKKWIADHIENTEIPPVKFEIDGECSCKFEWEKKVGKLNTVTDYAETDFPVKRSWYMIEYTDRAHGIGVELKVTSYPDYPVVEYEGYIVNLSDKNSPEIKNVKSLRACVAEAGKVTVKYNQGSRYCQEEFRPLTEELTEGGTFGFQSICGKPTNEFLPLMNIVDEEKGTGVISVLGWAGRWRKDVKVEEGKVKVTDGEYLTDFVLLPHERFRTPIEVLMFYRGEMIDGQNLWRRWLYDHNVLRYTGHRYGKPTAGVCIGDPYPNMMGNAADDILNAKKLKETGLNEYIDEFVQDAGWYDCAPEGWGRTGNWRPDPVRYPDGLGAVADAVHEAGMTYRVWFEPDRVHGGTEEAKVLGDKLIGVKNVDGKLVKKKAAEYTNGENLDADYSEPETLKYVIEFVNRNLDEGHIDTYRQDFNFCPGEYWVAKDNYLEEKLGVPRQGITEEKYTAGYQKLWQSIVERHPGMMIDCCASGGMRDDLETIRYSYAHTRTDWWYNVEDSQCHNIGVAAWLINMGGASPESANPLTVEGEYDPYQYRTEMVTSLGVGLNFINDVPQEKIDSLKRMITKWKDLAQYVCFDFYPLMELKYTHDCVLANQYDSPEQKKGVILIYERPEAEGEYTVHPTHLEPDAEYTVKDMDSGEEFKITGKEFMEKGISGTANKARHSREFRYCL